MSYAYCLVPLEHSPKIVVSEVAVVVRNVVYSMCVYSILHYVFKLRVMPVELKRMFSCPLYERSS
jgi:hypothetical protein